MVLLAFAVLLGSFPALAQAAGKGPIGDLASPPVNLRACTWYDTLSKGQQRINQGQYEEAITVFSCVIAEDPLTVDAYRGRSEAKLLLGRFSDAFRDYARLTAAVQPEDMAELADSILASYDVRLCNQPDVPALTGASFARWVFFQYEEAIPLLNQLLAINPNNVYANLFRGSNRLFAGVNVSAGEADLDRAIQLAPQNAHVRHIVADAYTYALPDMDRAFDEATLALDLGLDTPRVHAILAAVLNADGDLSDAATHIQRHINLSTAQNINTSSLAVGGVKTLNLTPWRTYQIPIHVTAGQAINITTSSLSTQVWDSILVVLGPDGTPVVSGDDYIDYFAGVNWVAPTAGTYTLRVTSFEAVTTGPLVVTRY